MQNTRALNMVSTAVNWVEMTYSSLRVDAYAVFGVITLLVVLLCAGAYQEAVHQAYIALGSTSPQAPEMMNIVSLVNQYGLALLVGICYFSNATERGTRRELFIDIVSISLGVLLPQLVFHATTVWTMQDVIVNTNLTVNGAVVSAMNTEWMIVWALSLVVIGLAFHTWRVAQRGNHHQSYNQSHHSNPSRFE